MVEILSFQFDIPEKYIPIYDDNLEISGLRNTDKFSWVYEKVVKY
jgi:hypothetical protein